MKGERAPRRHPASAFPEITGVRLAPGWITAALLNLSATGILVECGSRVVPGSYLTVHFEGTSTPASIDSRVIRCEVTGIAPDGTLRFHLGLAFNSRLALALDEEDEFDEPASPPSPIPAVAAVPGAPVLRNRW
jgi:hypothetical protein